MPAAVDSSFDVAFWFLDVALDHNEYLQPQKLQRLMFLSQAYYAVAFSGKKLMPCVFVAEEAGPLEPSTFKAFAKGRPDVDVELVMPQQVEMFLDSIWRRFGHHSPDYLNRVCKDNKAYRNARKKGRRAEITAEAMNKAFAQPASGPGIEQVMRPKVMRSHTGKPVSVKTWMPGLAKTGNAEKQK
ncbi:MAG: hypothetical protein OQJ76_07085 [Rhodospirillales bacterium]|nr:hypothetical protein [Rhodospirillales bacterium]